VRAGLVILCLAWGALATLMVVQHASGAHDVAATDESLSLDAQQYEVLGCLAHGGLGWIYLAKDHNVSDRWVVLKGLLDTGDADAMAAAVAERQFLAEVEHPNIVRIYNFVQHADRRTGEMVGYIVMEYVGGKWLKQILADARQAGGSVPVAHALAYAIEVLPALGHLHDRGMVYRDFKPDNVIQTEEQLKLIDLGGVRRIDSDEAIYGTVGYQAPEIEADGPSPSSDLYAVGRALPVLTFEFRGFQNTYKYSLPDGVPLLGEQESFARLLLRGPPSRIPASGSAPRERWPSSSPACCARCSPLPTGCLVLPSPACSAPKSRPSGPARNRPRQTRRPERPR
jgi:serine/threonine protein kinase